MGYIAKDHLHFPQHYLDKTYVYILKFLTEWPLIIRIQLYLFLNPSLFILLLCKFIPTLKENVPLNYDLTPRI